MSSKITFDLEKNEIILLVQVITGRIYTLISHIKIGMGNTDNLKENLEHYFKLIKKIEAIIINAADPDLIIIIQENQEMLDELFKDYL